jgi:MFS family permease
MMNHPRPPLPRNVRVLGWASCLNDVASEMIFPLMPQFLLTLLGGSRLQLGVIEGVAETVASLLKLWSGAWSDRASGRRAFVLGGYALAALARPAIALAGAPWHLFALRIADRTGKGIRTAPRDALIADSAAADQRGQAFGFHRAMDHLGAAIGPVIATLLLWQWPGRLRMVIALTLIPGMLVLLLLWFGLQAPARQSGPARPLRLSLRPFDRRFRVFLLALVIFTLGNSSDAFLLLRAGELGVPTLWLPTLWFGFHLIKSGGNLLAGPAVDRLGPRKLLVAGWTIYALVYLAFGLAANVWQVCACFLAYALHYAITEPAEKTMAANLVTSEQRGLAFGWFNLAIGVAALPSSVIFGWLYEAYGAAVAFGWGAALALLAASLLAVLRDVRAE